MAVDLIATGTSHFGDVCTEAATRLCRVDSGDAGSTEEFHYLYDMLWVLEGPRSRDDDDDHVLGVFLRRLAEITQ